MRNAQEEIIKERMEIRAPYKKQATAKVSIPKKVWVVSENQDEDQRVRGVYSSKENALAVAKAWHSVLVFEIDASFQD